MNETSLSLLELLCRSDANESWQRLVELYSPLIRSWLRKYDVQASDTDDLVQEVLLAVSKDVAAFEHGGRPGSFRAWLKAILVNRLRAYWRKRDRQPQARADSEVDARLAALADPNSEISLLWNREHDQYVLRRLLALAEPHFTRNSWLAFQRVALDGAAPEVGVVPVAVRRTHETRVAEPRAAPQNPSSLC